MKENFKMFVKGVWTFFSIVGVGIGAFFILYALFQAIVQFIEQYSFTL